MNPYLFADERGEVALAPGATLLSAFARPFEKELVEAVERLAQEAPFRHMETPGGHRMSVLMTNCGALGWVSDRRGYRYDSLDPESGRPWPAMPDVFARLAARGAAGAGFAGFADV
jgi:alkylated DNA repair protein (DNA oxidative demethylase)